MILDLDCLKRHPLNKKKLPETPDIWTLVKLKVHLLFKSIFFQKTHICPLRRYDTQQKNWLLTDNFTNHMHDYHLTDLAYLGSLQKVHDFTRNMINSERMLKPRMHCSRINIMAKTWIERSKKLKITTLNVVLKLPTKTWSGNSVTSSWLKYSPSCFTSRNLRQTT